MVDREPNWGIRTDGATKGFGLATPDLGAAVTLLYEGVGNCNVGGTKLRMFNAQLMATHLKRPSPNVFTSQHADPIVQTKLTRPLGQLERRMMRI